MMVSLSLLVYKTRKDFWETQEWEYSESHGIWLCQMGYTIKITIEKWGECQ
jgi:hypothetical protein